MQGKLVIFSAPSGSGKTTLVKHLLHSGLSLSFSVSATSRKPRNGETHGKDYYFLSHDEFKKKIKEEEFLEWEEVYNGQYYGTLKSEVFRIWEKGNHVIFDIDVLGGLSVKKKYPNCSLAIFVMPPDLETLEERLITRETETRNSLKKRLEKARYEISFSGEFDLIIVNDQLEKSKEEAYNHVKTFLKAKNLSIDNVTINP